MSHFGSVSMNLSMHFLWYFASAAIRSVPLTLLNTTGSVSQRRLAFRTIASLQEKVSTLDNFREFFLLLPVLEQNKQQVLYEKEMAAGSERVFFW